MSVWLAFSLSLSLSLSLSHFLSTCVGYDYYQPILPMYFVTFLFSQSYYNYCCRAPFFFQSSNCCRSKSYKLLSLASHTFITNTEPFLLPTIFLPPRLIHLPFFKKSFKCSFSALICFLPLENCHLSLHGPCMIIVCNVSNTYGR